MVDVSLAAELYAMGSFLASNRWKRQKKRHLREVPFGIKFLINMVEMEGIEPSC